MTPPGTTCDSRVDRKPRTVRGVYWLDSSCRVTIVSDEVRLAMVISDPEIEPRIVRADSGLMISCGRDAARPAASARARSSPRPVGGHRLKLAVCSAVTEARHRRCQGMATPRIVTGPLVGSSSVACAVPGGVSVSITFGTFAGSTEQIGAVPPAAQTPNW